MSTSWTPNPLTVEHTSQTAPVITLVDADRGLWKVVAEELSDAAWTGGVFVIEGDTGLSIVYTFLPIDTDLGHTYPSVSWEYVWV